MADDIEYSLDPSGYLVGINQVDAANQRIQSSLQGVVTSSSMLQRAFDMVTPKRATIAGLGLLAQQSAQTQQALSGLQATSTVTGVSVDKLAGGVRQLARDMPIGANGARQLVEQYSKLGVAGAGSERQILALSKATTQLSGATGEGPAQLAQGMTDLARATGNQNLDPRRIQALGDSLTTISAKSGASATGILSFAKSLAPMAQTAGIGGSAILGISSAFSRLGEDGFVGANTINKMLSDMNRSVREGSPQMATYAQIVGKTTDQFQALFKSNPAEALTQITEAIAKAGPSGGRVLEQLGIDSVRGQRSIQALVASGGLRGAVQTSVDAYGSGSTQRASEAAFGGLNDSLTRLQSTSGQLADALGAPLLRPLTMFTDALQKPIGLLSNIANSGAAQTGMGALAYGGVAALGLSAVAKPVSAYMLGRQALTSLPLRGLIGGLAEGLGARESGKAMRFGRPLRDAIDIGQTPDTMGGRLGERAYFAGMGFGEKWRELNPPGGPSLIGALRRGVGTYGQNFAQSYFGMLEAQARNATDTSGLRRTDSLGASKAFQEAWAAARSQGGGGISSLASSVKAFNDHVTKTGAATATFRETLMAAGGAARASGGFAIKGMGADFGRGAKMLGSLIGPEMGIGLGIAGISALVGTGLSRQAAMREENAGYANQDIAGTINSYRESIGRATSQMGTFGSVSEQNNRQLATNALARGFSATKTVSGADITAAQAAKSKITHVYAGNASQIAAQIRTMSPTGVSADELQAIKVDLLKQYDSGTVNAILGQLPGSFEAGSGGTDVGALAGQVVRGLASAPKDKSSRNLQALEGNPDTFGGNLNITEGNPLLPNFLSTQAGGGLYTSTLTGDTKKGVQSLVEGINQQFVSNGQFGGQYATQQRIQAYNAALKAAVDSGNGDLFYEISKRAGQDLGGSKFANSSWSASKFQAAGGDFSKVLAGYSPEFAATRKSMLGAGGNAFTGGLTPQRQEQTYTAGIRGQSVFLGDIFNGAGVSSASRMMTRSLALPENIGRQGEALSSVVDGAHKAGMSMQELATQAAKAANATAEGSDAWQKLKAVQQRAELEMGHEQAGMSTGQRQMAQYKYYSDIASIVPTTQSGLAAQQQAQQNLQGLQDEMRQRMVARLQMQRQYDVQVQRATEEHNRQLAYAQTDYQTQIDRTERNFNTSRTRQVDAFHRQQKRAEDDFNISRTRTTRDFNINLGRQEADFGISRTRQVRDYNISAQRAEADYMTSRARQIRDFNTSIKRQVEDLAKGLMDPYKRIQTQATWDARNLLVNLGEQNTSMTKQLNQLASLREAGLSQAAIDQLGLGKVENAQQVNNLSADTTTNPDLIRQLNEAAVARDKIAAQFQADPSNTDAKRAREDFDKALKDSEADYAKSVQRGKDDLGKMLSDSQADFDKAIARSRADLARTMTDQQADFRKSVGRSQQDFSISLAQAQQDLNVSLGDMAKDFDKSIARQNKAFDVSMANMAKDISMADQEISGSFESLAEQTNRAIHGKAVNWQKILRNDTQSWVTAMQKDVIPKINSIFAGYGLQPTTDAARSSGGGTQMVGGGKPLKAGGGSIPGYSPHSKADNIPIMATAGEYMQPVDAVQHYGPGVMDAIRAKKIPRELMAGYADGGLIDFGHVLQKRGFSVTEHPLFGGVHPVHTKGSQHYNKFGPGGGGAIDVNHDQGNEKDAINTIVGLAAQYGLRTIWQVAGHYNHAHFDIAKGPDMLGAAVAKLAGVRGQVTSIDDVLKLLPNGGWASKGLTKDFRDAFVAKYGTSLIAAAAGDMGAHGPNAAANQAIARAMLGSYGFAPAEMASLIKLWNGESGWNQFADNPSSDAYGIPQALPGSKMSSAGADWKTNPATQIRWGLGYIRSRYGSPSKAWSFWNAQSPHWYDEGGVLQPGLTMTANATGGPESVLTKGQWDDMSTMAELAARVLSQEDGKSLAAATGTYVTVNNNQQYTYDNRNDFGGAQITVVSQDPDEMGRKLEAKATASRLTQTKGVRWGQ